LSLITNTKHRTFRWGFVARNNIGEFLEGGCGNLCRVATSFEAEALAALHSLQRVAQLGMLRIILETDVTELVQGLTSVDLDQSVDGRLLMQIRDFIGLSFNYCDIRHCLRNCNKVADCLAMYGASVVSSGSTVFVNQVPTFVSNLVSSDLAGDDV
jgi:ribonuclease HI